VPDQKCGFHNVTGGGEATVYYIFTMKSSIFSLVDHEVFAVSASAQGRRSACIATWVLPTTLRAQQPQCLFLSSPLNFTHQLIRGSRRFVLQLLSEGQEPLLPRLGLRSGRETDKLEAIDHRITAAGDIILEGTCGYLVAEVQEEFSLSERVAFIGRVLEQRVFTEKKPLKKMAAFNALDPQTRAQLEAKRGQMA
jgi:flavin reductase (DIM6/NTAB) family NADH-FMN oxidoreductase RutF